MTIREIVLNQRAFFDTGETKLLRTREDALESLRIGILTHKQNLLNALKMDLGKSETESYMTEIGIILTQLEHAQKELEDWVKPRSLPVALAQMPGKAVELSEPFGVTLIMSPWNYPFMLTLNPLIGALAAGNCCILKPSNRSPHTSKAIKEMIADTFSPDYVTVVEGGRKENTELLDEKFDYIFFTGGSTVGRVVLESAARHLTPVTLELGGKSPAIVDKTADIDLAAKRIAFGKVLNSGQTCVAPDYVLADEVIKDELIARLGHWFDEMAGKDAVLNPDYPHIINKDNFDRIIGLVGEEKIVYGGKANVETLRISPTILDDITLESKVMQEEIFGPLLPIISYSHINEAKEIVRMGHKPLALYLFTTNKNIENNVLTSLSFGGGCVNDTVMQLASPYMAFGGVGESGMGRYFGKHSFDTFSHKKSILVKSNKGDFSFRYPPYSKLDKKLIEKFM